MGEDSANTAGNERTKHKTNFQQNILENNEETVHSPMSGKAIRLSEVQDEVFRSGAMGQGLAIEPSDNKLYAPFDGTVVMVAPTKHAIGLRSQSGIELLVHIGLDTVQLNGKPFTLHVNDGDKFKKGDLLITFDKELIQSKGVKTTTPIIITNSDDYNEIIIEDVQDVTFDQKLFTIIK